ncbi:MAG: cobalt-precorrin-6A reductase [Rhodospirillales bacterium]
MSSDVRPHILILGGTAEAAALARAIADSRGAAVRLTSSLAGRVEKPGPLPGEVRVGGFGGPAGLATFIRENGVGLLIDATHPFADRISRNARLAAEAAGIPRLGLDRALWKRDPRDRWIEVASMEQAARAVGDIATRAFLTVGRTEIAPFAACRGVWFLVRLVDPPSETLPLANHETVIARGPFSPAGERDLMAHHRIGVVVTKASGGTATEAKIIAAREADIPVLMVRRPKPEPGRRVASVEAALDWISDQLPAD